MTAGLLQTQIQNNFKFKSYSPKRLSLYTIPLSFINSQLLSSTRGTVEAQKG